MPRKLVLAAFLAVFATGAASDPLHFDTASRWMSLPFASAASNALVLFGRVDGDAKEDLVYYNFVTGEAFLATSTGRSFNAPVRVSYGLPRFSDKVPTAGLVDVNGDGHADLVVLNQGADDVPGAATAVVALWDGRGFQYPANPTWNASWCADYQICLFGDLNGDHKADMVAYTPNFGTLWGSLSGGSAFGANGIWNSYFCIKGEVCALGDVNGDGKSDAILFKPHAPPGQKGNVLYALSSGTNFGAVATGHGYFCIDNERCLVGDVDGDKKSDIVLVKGFGTGASRLEVLVSKSNGSAFINATPFAWANPEYFSPANQTFGMFALADVTGDGKADLVEYGILSVATGGGGFRSTGHAVDVFPVTDRSSTVTPPPVTLPSLGGFSAVRVYNCHPDQNRLNFHTFDLATGAHSRIGPIDAMYSESGSCPDLTDSPQTLPLADGHQHAIIAVDPQAIGCDGRDDPNIVGCVNNSAAVLGKASGPVCNWIVSAQAPFCGR